MLTILGLLISGVMSGGATGLLGVLLQRYFDLQNKKQDIEALKLNLANSVELSKMESDRARLRAETDIQVAETDADAKVLVASYEHDEAKYIDKESLRKPGKISALIMLMMGFVDFLRGALRPGMTIYLCFLVSAMFAWVKNLADQYGIVMTPDQVISLITQIIATILYVFTTVTLWWFGTRPPKGKFDK